jgi:hypothetical protein
MSDGGSAFPWTEIENDGGLRSEHYHAGMTLLDWYAGQALVACGLSNPQLPDDLTDEPWPNPAQLARRKAIWAYQQAEAMLKERERWI